MSTTKLAIGVAGVVIVAATALTFQQRQTNFQLRAEVAALHQQVGAMATLREENRRLQESNAASADQVSAEHGEVVKLRGELDTIKKAIAAARARMANGTNANATAGTGKSADADGMFSVDLMKNVGNATPNAAAESIVWAMQRADVKRVAALLRVESPDREKLEAFIQTMPPNLQDEYGSPAKLIALMMCGTPRPLAAVQQLGEEQVSDNEIVHHVQMKFQDGEVRRDDIRFRRDIDGWKQVVSPTTVDRVIAYFKDKK